MRNLWRIAADSAFLLRFGVPLFFSLATPSTLLLAQSTPPSSCYNVHCPSGRTVPCPNAHPTDQQVRAACGMGGSGGYIPSGPSPEEIKRQHEAKDSREAADDASDKGVDAYKKGDWDKAVQYFKEGLEYEPDDPDLQTNLRRAQEKSRQAHAALAARELVSANAHSTAAVPNSNTAEARKVFDTAGKDAGGINVAPVVTGSSTTPYKDPVVPTEKRTPAIAKLEDQRAALRKDATALDDKMKTLDPKKDSVEIAKIKQQKSDLDNKVNYLNFSINEELKTPSPAQPSAKPQ